MLHGRCTALFGKRDDDGRSVALVSESLESVGDASMVVRTAHPERARARPGSPPARQAWRRRPGSTKRPQRRVADAAREWNLNSIGMVMMHSLSALPLRLALCLLPSRSSFLLFLSRHCSPAGSLLCLGSACCSLGSDSWVWLARLILLLLLQI